MDPREVRHGPGPNSEPTATLRILERGYSDGGDGDDGKPHLLELAVVGALHSH